MTIQKRIVDEIIEENKQKDNVIAMCVFGSVAINKERSDSDVDIQIIYDDNHEWELFKKEKYDIKIDYEIITKNIIEMLIEKYPYLSYNLLYTNKILYDPKDFMKNIQKKLKEYFDSHPEVKSFWDNENRLMREKKGQSLKPKNFIEVCDEAEIKFSGYNEIRRNILNTEFFKKHLKVKKMSNNNIKEKYNKLVKTEMYKEFIEHNPEYKLTHLFFVSESDNLIDEQIGFYSEKVDKVVSFDLIRHSVSEPENAAKTSGTIPDFNVEDIKVDITDALKISKKLIDKEYSQHNTTKSICILQVLNKVLTWNITIVTNTLHMINIKIDAKDKSIISHSAQPIMSLAQK